MLLVKKLERNESTDIFIISGESRIKAIPIVFYVSILFIYTPKMKIEVCCYKCIPVANLPKLLNFYSHIVGSAKSNLLRNCTT